MRCVRVRIVTSAVNDAGCSAASACLAAESQAEAVVAAHTAVAVALVAEADKAVVGSRSKLLQPVAARSSVVFVLC